MFRSDKKDDKKISAKKEIDGNLDNGHSEKSPDKNQM